MQACFVELRALSVGLTKSIAEKARCICTKDIESVEYHSNSLKATSVGILRTASAAYARKGTSGNSPVTVVSKDETVRPKLVSVLVRVIASKLTVVVS